MNGTARMPFMASLLGTIFIAGGRKDFDDEAIDNRPRAMFHTTRNLIRITGQTGARFATGVELQFTKYDISHLIMRMLVLWDNTIALNEELTQHHLVRRRHRAAMNTRKLVNLWSISGSHKPLCAHESAFSLLGVGFSLLKRFIFIMAIGVIFV
jgi:hypothetical protein